MNKYNNSLIDVIKYYVILSSAINISILLFIKDNLKPFISQESIDFIVSVFLVNICVVLVVSYLHQSGQSKRKFKEKRKISKNNNYKKYKHLNL